jgi:hypothetical protein
MADQAALKEKNGSARRARLAAASLEPGAQSPAMGTGEAAGQVVSNVAGFGENLLNLAELQARLATIELRQNVDAMKTAVIVLASAALIGLASLPVVLAGTAELLVSELAWRRGVAFLTVGLTTLAVAAFVAVAAAVWLSRKRFGFPLSTEEFTRNLNWVHTVLRLSGRSPAGRR